MNAMKRLTLFVCLLVMICGHRVFATPVPARLTDRLAAPNKSQDEFRTTIFTAYAGAAVGGKYNTAYFLKAKAVLVSVLHFEGSVYFNLDHTRLYHAGIAIGKNVALCAGLEWGERLYHINRDTTLELVKFKNTTTGQYASYASMDGITVPQDMNAYTFGLAFHMKKASVNYWRGKGRCWQLFDFKFEGMYAPKIAFDNPLVLTTQGTYEQIETSYAMENVQVKHWGFRMVADTRLSSKIGMMMEFGVRPGIKSQLNDQGRFSNGYLRIGVAIGFVAGARKELRAAQIENSEPEN